MTSHSSPGRLLQFPLWGALAVASSLAITACALGGDPAPSNDGTGGAAPAAPVTAPPSSAADAGAPAVALPPTSSAGAPSIPPATTDAGATQDAGAASADAAPTVASICTYADGRPVPYDHTRGIVEEYSLELFSSCDLGGYMAPLVNADPVNLSEVTTFNAALTDWYRARILGCADATTTAPDGSLLLLPLSEAADVSRGDVNAVVKLYMTVLARHDGQPDGYDEPKKAEVKKRLLDLEPTAAKHAESTLSKPSTDPGCTPSNPDAG